MPFKLKVWAFRFAVVATSPLWVSLLAAGASGALLYLVYQKHTQDQILRHMLETLSHESSSPVAGRWRGGGMAPSASPLTPSCTEVSEPTSQAI